MQLPNDSPTLVERMVTLVEREDASSLSVIRSAEKGRQGSHGCRKRQHQRKDVETKPWKLICFHTDEALDIPTMAQDLLDAHQLNHACF